MEMIRFEMDKDEYGRPPSNEYVQFLLTIVKYGILEKDIAYFKGDEFEKHFNLIPDVYFSQFMGLDSEEVTIELMRELLIKRIQNG